MLNHTNAQVELFRTASVVGAPVLDSVFLARARLENGTAGVKIATGAKGENVVGIAHVRAVAQRFATVIKEEHVVASDLSIVLAKTPELDSVSVFNKTQNAKVDVANLTWKGATGTAAADKGVAAADVLQVTYRYRMSMLEVQSQGLPIDFANQVTGNDGTVELATGRVSVEIDNFDTNAEYTVDAPVYVSADGLPTTIKGEGEPVAFVTSEPTATNPVLGIAGFFVFY